MRTRGETLYYNFSYVDQIYDGLLAAGVKPLRRTQFHAQSKACDAASRRSYLLVQTHRFSSQGLDKKWDNLISHFAQHLIERYGIGEVSQWYFEVWNEPNIDFWAGNPKEATYYRALRQRPPEH